MKFLVPQSLPPAGRRWLALALALAVAVAGAASLRAQDDPAAADADQPGNLPASANTGSDAGSPADPALGTDQGAPPRQPGARRGSRQGTGQTDADRLTRRSQEGPIEISSQGQTTYAITAEGRVATFTGQVNIVTDDASIYCDRADYNADTHEGILTGDVRIFRTDTSLVAERAVYNFNTKQIRALDFSGDRPPYDFSGVGVFSPGQGLQYNLRNANFTTDDRSRPDFHLRARRVRIYPDDRVIYVGATLFIGTTPVFYFPYFFQSLDQQSGYQITPGYSSVFGAYLLSGVTFPIANHVTGLVRLDYRTSRGVAGGLSFTYKPNKKQKLAPESEAVDPYANDDDPDAPRIIARPDFSLGNAAVEARAAANRRGGGPTEGSVFDPGGGDGALAPGARELTLTGERLSRQIRGKEEAVFTSYFIHDDKPDLNRTGLRRFTIDGNRYRFKLQSLLFITDDLFVKTDLDKLSDRYLLQDFYEAEFTRNPNPNNDFSIVYYQPAFVATLTAQLQLNHFFDATERLPELALDVPRRPLGASGVFWESESSIGRYARSFDEGTVFSRNALAPLADPKTLPVGNASFSSLVDYTVERFDTFHQFTAPQTLFDWLSVVPRVGLRATYYTQSAPASTAAYNLQFANDSNNQTLLTADPTNLSTADQQRRADLLKGIGAFQPRGSVFRPVLNAGFESSFKLSRVYDGAESRALGLDKIQHVIQPYVDVSFIDDFGVGSRRLLQFDRLLPTTQLAPIEFPQFNSLDTIDTSTAVRVGVRNRLQTKRDALTFNWLETDTFFQTNVVEPNRSATFANTNSRFSNLFNQVTFRPLPWASLTVDSQLPVFNPRSGFSEVNTALDLQASGDLHFTVQHRYIDHNPFFVNSSLLQFNAFYRLDDNWAAGFTERYEFAQRILQAQSYTLYRDLSAFVGAFGVTVRNNGGVSDYGVQFNFTVKGVPRINLPVGYDVNALSNQTAR